MNFATKWDQMSDLEQASAIWWDLYKDVHGVRPRGVDTSNWTLEGFNAQINALSTALEEQMEEERQNQTLAIQRFESRVQDTILAGAGNRETAIQWIMRDSGMGEDQEYIEFRFNLPFGYLRNV
jgi:hypothetical protein